MEENQFIDKYGFVYSQDCKRLLLAAPQVSEYWIPEGVERIDRFAFMHCQFETLHIPYTVDFGEAYEYYPIFGQEEWEGCVVEWDVPYANQDLSPNPLCRPDGEQTVVCDGVRFSQNGHRLISAQPDFDRERYEVPHGVVTVCDLAFAVCRHHLTLVVPPTVRVIGDCLFGGGGTIVIGRG